MNCKSCGHDVLAHGGGVCSQTIAKGHLEAEGEALDYYDMCSCAESCALEQAQLMLAGETMLRPTMAHLKALAEYYERLLKLQGKLDAVKERAALILQMEACGTQR